eukprot:PhM_4_TR2084/c5_g1_i1/m.91652/K01784/galE, GALE; UDP-glucose 4-epimerase
MRVIVFGGAGYIGSHTVREILRATSHDVLIVDNLSAGYKASIPADPRVALAEGDVRDEAFLRGVFASFKPDAVVHMCASIVVPESVADPLKYYDNNVFGAIRILQAMKEHGCDKIVFSSTAALFGTPERSPIHPDDRTQPESPYGYTKLVTEVLLKDCDTAYGIRNVCLRYFNACGAEDGGCIGECHKPETHLIPIVLQVALGQREKVSVFGTDYATPDGTCVRDYIHVQDLASAHILALAYLEKGGKSDCFNLGNGNGHSVRQIIEAAREVTGHAIPTVDCERRAGDPPSLVASAEKAKAVLGWCPKWTEIADIIRSAWGFHSTHPKGYDGL